ncbi:Uncharacterised protein [Brevundimonas vesicularis]|uniref:Uncharacterized protein n=1 Tax=Brevundimonas vesicularis TaxID=41276 RepID=A0A2X1BNF5_BREVE|nr:Uncharacterised protein [Brevundimonas vesicularis]
MGIAADVVIALACVESQRTLPVAEVVVIGCAVERNRLCQQFFRTHAAVGELEELDLIVLAGKERLQLDLVIGTAVQNHIRAAPADADVLEADVAEDDGVAVACGVVIIINHILTVALGEGVSIVAEIALQPIIARPAFKGVFSRAAIKRIVAVAAKENIIAIPTA